jgi:hypothetical protein
LEAAKKEFKHLSRDAWAYYPKLFAVCGGKGNYELIKYGYSDNTERVIIQSETLNTQKRNIKIAKKLIGAEITEVVSVEFACTNDGFNGFFDVLTAKGNKRVTIDTLYAGGYNVQCAHLRVLVKVK